MTDRSPDPEPDRSAAPEQPPCECPPESPPGDGSECAPDRASPAFAWWSTLAWSVALAVAAGFVLFSITNSREQLIEHPEAYLERVVGRDLDSVEYASQMPAWEKWLNLGQVSTRTEVLSEGITLYQKYETEGILEDVGRVKKTLAILLAEAGRIDEAQQELNEPVHLGFRSVFEAAYAPNAGTALLPDDLKVVQSVTPDWARDTLARKLAVKRGDSAAAHQLAERLQARGARLQRRATLISVVNFMLVASGFVVLGVWGWRRWPLAVGQGHPVSRWTMADGYAVLVRGAMGGIIIAGSLSYLSSYVIGVTGFTTLIAAVPLFLLTREYLIPCENQSWPGTFGLVLPRGTARRLVLITLAVAALMIVGEAGLAELTARWQDAALPESIPEEFLFNSWSEVLLSALDALIWAPLVEEIAFRGLLYASLRRRLGVFAAAGVSSAIFGVVHGYSLQGLLIICWSGFVWALAYEKSRSLWPGILCHAMSNLLAVASPILLYRL